MYIIIYDLRSGLMKKIPDIMKFLKSYDIHSNVISLECIFSNKTCGNLLEMLQFYFNYIITQCGHMKPLKRKYLNLILDTHNDSLDVEQINNILIIMEEYSKKDAESIDIILELFSSIKFEDYREYIINYIIQNKQLLDLFRYSDPFINLLIKVAHFSKEPNKYIKILEKIDKEKAIIAKKFNIYYDIDKLKNIWNKLSINMIKKYALKIRDHAHNPEFLDYFLEYRILNDKRISEKTISEIIIRSLVGTRDDFIHDITKHNFYGTKKIFHFVDKYYKYIFNRYTVKKLNNIKSYSYNIFTLFNQLFAKNNYISNEKILNYLINESLGDALFLNKNQGGNIKHLIDSFTFKQNIGYISDVLKSRLKNNGQHDHIINFQETLEKILDDIENSKTIPKKYLLLVFVLFNNSEIYDSLYTKLFGENNLKKLLEIQLDSTINLFNKYDNILKYLNNSILNNHDYQMTNNDYPGYMIFRPDLLNQTYLSKKYINYNIYNDDIVDEIDKNEFIQKTKSEIINAAIFRIKDITFFNEIYHNHDKEKQLNAFIEDMLNKNIMINIKTIYNIVRNDIESIILKDNKILEKIRKVLHKYLELSIYFKPTMKYESYQFNYHKFGIFSTKKDLICIIHFFKKLHEKPDIIKLFADFSTINDFIEIIEKNIEELLSINYPNTFDRNDFIQCLEETINKNNNKNNDSIDIIKTIYSYYKLLDLNY